MKKFLNNLISLLEASDKSLIIISLVLLVQCFINLFYPSALTKQAENIDIVFRRSIAAIFGYFISSNFINRKQKQNTSTQNNTDTQNNNDTQNISNKSPNISKNFQIVFVSIVGITSLIVLIIARDFVSIFEGDLQTIDLLKDLVSGATGFLMGFNSSKNN